MHMVWLNSKTTVPSVTGTAIERGRLNNLLREGNSARMTIVRAPAGYGKTTMLSHWFSQLDELVAWLSIDAIDNDPIRFWKYIIHTVSDTLTNDMDTRLFPLLNSQSPLELLIDSFLNEISSIQGNLHIVIDDYHFIDNIVIHEMMVRFIDYLPSNTRVYIASRTDLTLPLDRWRVKSWLTEIGMDQLCLTYEEMERYYEKKNLVFNDDQLLQHVLEMTEGWAAGIQLAGLSIAASENDGSHVERFDGTQPFIAEFLIKEILATLSPSTQDFLLQTSVLTSLEPETCNLLTNRSDSYDVLLKLEKMGMFIIRLYSSSPVFRYHQLFADTLQTEMKNRYRKEQVLTIYKEAANLLCEKGDFISAIELVLQQQVYDLADTWITTYLVEIFTTGQITIFMRWVETFRKNNYPLPFETVVMYTIALTSIYELEKAKQIILELEQRHEVDQWMDNPEHQGIASILTTLKAYVIFGIGDGIEQAAEIIVNQLQRGRVSSRWDNIPMQYNQVEAKIFRTTIGSKGKIYPIDKSILFSGLFRQSEFKEQNMTGFSYAVLAETMYEADLIDDALPEIESGLQYAYRFQDSGLFVPLYILKSRIYMKKGQLTAAQAILDHALEGVTEWYWIRSLQAMKAYCYLLADDIEQAQSELFKTKRPDILKIELGQEFWLLVYVRFLLAKRRHSDALKTVIRVKEKALKENQISTIIEAAVLEAVCYFKLADEDLALMVLHDALEHGAPYGYKRTLVDEADVIPLLKKYLRIRQMEVKTHWNSVSLSYVEQLLEANKDEFVGDAMIDTLTPREKDVLQLLVNGASNHEIASQLFLTEGTVRVYLSVIYSKLGVHSRTKALLLAKEWKF